MRPYLALLLFLLAAISSAQKWDPAWRNIFEFANNAADEAAGRSMFHSAKPDIVIQVSKHKLGADLVEINAIAPGYPLDLINRQAMKMCELTGVAPRGLFVGVHQVGSDPNMGFTQASYSTNNLIDRDSGVLHLNPIIKAFAGAPDPYTVHNISVLFNGEKPTTQTLRSFQNANVRVEATFSDNPSTIEYRIQLLSQDPAKIGVPDESPNEPKPTGTPSVPQSVGGEWITWVALGLAAIAAAALVYFFTTRPSGKRPI